MADLPGHILKSISPVPTPRIEDIYILMIFGLAYGYKLIADIF